MSKQPAKGISRSGVDVQLEADEARKSALILEAQRLLQQQDEAAAARFAQAAEIEEQLSEACEARALLEKALIHRFSAASCWAQAGNFYRAIVLCDGLLNRPELPEGLARRVREYTRTIRSRRSSWYAELASTATAAES
jgi:hypothetical protein